MRFDEFERRANEEWERIPAKYRDGVDGLVIERRANRHDRLDDIYTLGECVTESYPSDWGGPDTIRSFVVLYYGSFDRLARLDPSFDWEAELRETMLHELQHHLESLADEEALTEMDYAVDEDFKRREGEPFDPTFYRAGEPLGDGWYRVDAELFVERDVDAESELDFVLEEARYRVTLPEDTGDVAFLEIVEGLPESAPPVTLIAVRRRGLVERVRSAWRGDGRRIVQATARAWRA